MSALFVEIPGDGSTQGTEPSHMHSRNDENYYRGYEWWIMSEAKKRNPAITLDGVAWSCPGWVGNGNFWSQDMCDYYVKWIKGLKSEHGLDMDAIGCRNEKGVSEDFIKKFRATLNANGLSAVKLHGFDNWQRNKFDWVKDMAKDPALKDAVDIVGNHTMAENPTPADVRKMLEEMGKPIWNTEEHVYKEDNFDCEISVVQAFNKNFIESGVTKIVTWFMTGSLYPIQPLPETPCIIVAHEPWSGNYRRAASPLGLRPLRAVLPDRLAVSQRRLRQPRGRRHLRDPEITGRGLQHHRRNQGRQRGAEGDLQHQRRAFHRQALRLAQQ